MLDAHLLEKTYGFTDVKNIKIKDNAICFTGRAKIKNMSKWVCSYGKIVEKQCGYFND